MGMERMFDPYYKLHAPIEAPDEEICHCERMRPMKLMVALGNNPIFCVDCNLEIQPESLNLDVPLIDDLARWTSIYDAVYRLWLDSGKYEKWAKKQLIDIHSHVNRRGLDLLPEMNRIRKCYFEYFQDESVDDFEPINKCPLCGQTFQLYKDGLFLQYICEQCLIITVAE
jgi:hypothetical protein